MPSAAYHRLMPALCFLIGMVASPLTAWAETRAGVVALALWSDQGVFLSEARRAAQLVSRRYGHGGAVVVRANSKTSFAAGPAGMALAIRRAERGLDADRDVLFVILTSHGSPRGIAEKGGGQDGILSPSAVSGLLAASKVRQKVLVVSACFSGVYTPLATPDLLVITAADATHPSFGCEAGATWTYFGDAFFNQALRSGAVRGEPLEDVFTEAAALVRARELAQGFDPSNPQMAGGAHVLATLDASAGVPVRR